MNNNNNIITVSVITPSYNQGSFIEETIRSVISQEGGFYLEYFIMDGGSNDNSVSIIKKYDYLIKNNAWKLKCLGIKYIWVSEKDKGQSHAINKGIKLSKGELLTYLNSDDCLCDGAIQSIICLKQDFFVKKYIFHGGADYIDGDSKFLFSINSKPFSVAELFFESYMIQPGTFFTRNLLQITNGFNENYVFAFDYDFFYKSYNHCEFFYIDKILSKVRLHSNSKTSTIISECEREMVIILEGFFSRSDISIEIKNNKENAILYHCFKFFLICRSQKRFKDIIKSIKLILQNIKTITGIVFLLRLAIKKILKIK